MVQFTDATTFSICRAPHFYCYSECCYAEFFLALEPNHTGGLYYKQVMIVIYDRNDIGLYYKTRDNRN